MIAIAVAGMLSAGAASAQVPSAAPPPTPNPTTAAPVRQTPLPATPTPAGPLQSPGVTSPLQNPSATSPSATSPSTSAAQAPAGTTAGTTTMQNPNLAGSPIQMPTVIPSKAETASSAFAKLAPTGSTFVTREQANRLDGFDRAFSDADRNRDGQLDRDEFNAAWANYTGRM
jgi:hypothetical protein